MIKLAKEGKIPKKTAIKAIQKAHKAIKDHVAETKKLAQENSTF